MTEDGVRVDIVSIFPEALGPLLAVSIIGRARERGLVEIRLRDLRDFTSDRHRQVDDVSYGGGPGMVMKPEPFFAAVESLTVDGTKPHIVLTSPQGRRFEQRDAERLAREKHLIVLCGRYEGVDERVPLGLGAEELSIGDYVLTGGELAALVIVDATVRLVPGVVGDERSVAAESFTGGLLDYPHYTRPAEFRGLRVPDVLLTGHHEQIRRWRRREQLRRTLARRPDLITTETLSEEDRMLLRDESE
ncbi:MAG: tRNA (guanosine(37)-N1)-methyltransferase TrmD [Candidatus Methylomirabilaceae bacterium]